MWYNDAMASKTESYEDTILSELKGTLTPQAAEGILHFGFSDRQRQRMHELAEKARSGELTDEERLEADGYERVSSLLGILQSKARLSLKQSTP